MNSIHILCIYVYILYQSKEGNELKRKQGVGTWEVMEGEKGMREMI